MDYVLETNNLRKKYRRNEVLIDVNMHIEKGAIYGLIGKNGAGKTTLIRVICGLQKPTAGNYSICGVSNVSKDISKTRKKIGAIIESPSLCLNMSAEDNLKKQYKITGIPNLEGIHDILKIVKLDDKKNKKVKNFSLGMKQRLGIAIALVGSPDFIILDEPINGLDPEGIIEIRELILKLNKEKGITFLISSHYLDELSKIATCYGFLNDGKIVKEISKKELEQDFKKKIQIKIDNVKECVRYLEETRIPYKIISDEVIDIYEKINVTKLVTALSKRNCIVNNFQEKDETLESYYLNLIGGAEND